MTPDELGGELIALPPRVRKVLDAAYEQGWMDNAYTSIVVRLTREDAKPFFASWHWIEVAPGKRAWRFHGARAANGQQLNYNDIFEYLEDPTVIEPEPPEGE